MGEIMNKIIIIGTVPPCPRCELLTEIVKTEKELLKLDADVSHISYTKEEASEIAERIGMIPGTAKDVAKSIGEEIHLENMPKLVESIEIDPNFKQFEKLFHEVKILDDWLRPFEEKAKDAGILMTPVLIINGTIKHSGSVPDLKTIDEWLLDLF